MVAGAMELADLVRTLVRRLRERQVRIAVVGDIVLDNAIEGEPGGVHSEFKMPMLKEAVSSESIGGAANIALALARLGVEVTLIGVIGADLPGRQLENLLDRHPFSNYLIRQRGWPTPRKDWIYQKDGAAVRLTLRIDYDRPLPAEAREELLGEFRTRCPDQVDVVILADHDVGSIGPETLPLAGLAKERGAKVVAIPRSTILRDQPIDAIVLNGAEMRRLADAGPNLDPKPLAERYASERRRHVFLTLFEDGMTICPAGPSGAAPIHLPAYPLPQYDWMGVRDITTSVVALGLALEAKLPELGRLAMIFRHLVAGVRGNGRVYWRDIGPEVGIIDATELEIAKSPTTSGSFQSLPKLAPS